MASNPVVTQSKMRLFHLLRLEDESGVSGTGIVAEGVVFSTGRCVLNWLTTHSSTAMYDNVRDLEVIHGHNGKTKLVFVSESEA